MDLACLPVTTIVPIAVDAATGNWKGIKHVTYLNH